MLSGEQGPSQTDSSPDQGNMNETETDHSRSIGQLDQFLRGLNNSAKATLKDSITCNLKEKADANVTNLLLEVDGGFLSPVQLALYKAFQTYQQLPKTTLGLSTDAMIQLRNDIDNIITYGLNRLGDRPYWQHKTHFLVVLFDIKNWAVLNDPKDGSGDPTDFARRQYEGALQVVLDLNYY